MTITISYTAIIILIMLSGIFSAMSTAFKTTTLTKIKQLVSAMNQEKADKLIKLFEHKQRFSSTILFWDTLFILIIGSHLAYMDLILFIKNENLILYFLITFIILCFIKIIAQKIGSERSFSIIRSTSSTLEFLSRITQPIIDLFTTIAFPVLQIFGINIKKDILPVTEEEIEEEIRFAVKKGEESGFLEKEERDMIQSIIGFGDTIAREIMVPRIDMICIPSNSNISDYLNIQVKYGISRIPVFENSIDNITGVAYAKDVLRFLKEGKNDEKIDSILRIPLFVPSTKKIDDLFQEMQKDKISLAIVVDEYGGTDGLITMQDILEEIVGKLHDEHDIVSVSEIKKQDDGSYLINAKMIIEDINDALDLNIPVENFETIAGYVYAMLERVPKIGDKIERDNYVIKVEKTFRQRILEVKLVKK